MMSTPENNDEDKSQSKQDLNPQSQLVSTKASDQTVNKNIEDLKKSGYFDSVYSIFNRIALENDYDAMNFGMKEQFYKYSKLGRNIYDWSLSFSDFHLTRLILEFGGIYRQSDAIFSNSDFLRFNFKIPCFTIGDALIWASREGRYEQVKLLLTVPGIDINARDLFTETALMSASKCGNLKVVKLLLTVPGIDVNAKDNAGRTALIHASERYNFEVVKLLLAIPDIDVNAKDKDNWTALIHASGFGKPEFVKLLLSVPGIDVNAIGNDSQTALIRASTHNNYELVKLLLTAPGIDASSALSPKFKIQSRKIARLLHAFVDGVDKPNFESNND